MFQYQHAADVAVPSRGPSVSVDVLELAAWLWTRRTWALAGAGLFGVAALAASLAWPPTFQARAQLYIDPQNLQLLAREITPAVPSTDAGAVLIESQARILQSTSVLERAAEQLDLANDPEFSGSTNGLRVLLTPLLGTAGGAPEHQLLSALSKAVHAVRLDRTYIVEIHAKSRDADTAAAIANGVVTAYLELRNEQRAGQANLASSELESRLQQLLSQLKADEDAVQAFRTANGIVAANGALLIETQLAQSNQSLGAAREELQMADARLDQLQALAETPALMASLPEAAANPNLVRLRAEADAALRQAETLAANLGPRHPSLAQATAGAEAAEAAVATALLQLVADARLARDRAADLYAQTQVGVERLVGSVQAADADQVHLRHLTREAEASRAVYEQALMRARETREQAGLNTVNAYVVSQATPPADRSFPPRLSLMLPLALIVGLAAGLGLALLADRLPPGAFTSRRGGRDER